MQFTAHIHCNTVHVLHLLRAHCVSGKEADAADSTSESDVHRLEVDQSAITCCGFSSSHLLLAASSDEKKLKIWKTESWKLLSERSVSGGQNFLIMLH